MYVTLVVLLKMAKGTKIVMNYYTKSTGKKIFPNSILGMKNKFRFNLGNVIVFNWHWSLKADVVGGNKMRNQESRERERETKIRWWGKKLRCQYFLTKCGSHIFRKILLFGYHVTATRHILSHLAFINMSCVKTWRNYLNSKELYSSLTELRLETFFSLECS